MLAGVSNAQRALARPLCRAALASRSPLRAQVRTATSKHVTAAHVAPTNELSAKLLETGVWGASKGKAKRKKGAVRGDRHRVNVVSEQLCDDIVNYIGPSLDRHRGCDLLDINPGAGVWSRKLHETLQPRKHVMMEQDSELYSPFLADLLAKDNVEMVAKSGVVWKDLTEVLRDHLPDQQQHAVDASSTAEPQRNDTLLVSINLAMWPPKPWYAFDCVSTMVLYQLMTSIRTASLFERYGLVRVLVWVRDDGKRRLVPRSLVSRRRAGFEAELSCDWIHEVAGLDVEVERRIELRDEWINTESGYHVLERMRADGRVMPPGRETALYRRLSADPSLAGVRLAGVRRPLLSRPFRPELEELEAQLASGEITTPSQRLKQLRYRDKYDVADNTAYLELLKERDALMTIAQTDPDRLAAGDAAWNARVAAFKKNPAHEFVVLRDQYHCFRQDPPALFWDRRPYEPLATSAEDDFFPHVPCALLDLQPKAMHPLLRQQGPNSSRAGEVSELLLRSWFAHSLVPATRAMNALWPGFADLADQCPSLRDPLRGGSPLSGAGEVTARSINEAQWIEILEAFMAWPFRPEYTQLVGRLLESNDVDSDEDESKSSAMGE